MHWMLTLGIRMPREKEPRASAFTTGLKFIALPWTVEEGCERWGLTRRSRTKREERAYYFVFAPSCTALADLAAAAGLR
jgi:hypothetical protein